MQINGYELTYPRLLLAGILLITVTTAIFGLSTSSVAFGSHNPSWDGARDLRSVAATNGADVELTQSVAAYNSQSANQTTAFVLSPTDAYAQSDVEAVSGFLDRGGTVIVAEDFGTPANSLLRELGVTARFDGRLLRDEQHYYRGPAFPVALNVADSPLTANVSRLTLNHGTAIEPTANSTVVVNSSEFTYFDENHNGELDESEVVRERPVVVTERIDDGRVILVSDPSMFINAMLDAPDNRQFVQNLVADSNHVLIDYSHRSGVPWAVAIVLAVAESPLRQLVVVVSLVGICAAYSSDRTRRWFSS